VPRDENLIKNKINDGVDVYILCEKPKKHGKIQENILKLINIGAKVKFYEVGYETHLRGLVIDSEKPYEGMSLRITKTCKKVIKEIEGEPGSPDIYDYKAIHYFPHNDLHNIETMHQYFNSLFKFSPRSIIFRAIQISDTKVLDILKNIKQYEGISIKDINFEVLTLDEIWASCKYVKLPKIERLKHFVTGGELQGISPFENCLCTSSQGEKVILPPIVEFFDGKKIVIDGMHRLYLHLILNKKSSAICLVINSKIPTPSNPIPFSEVKITHVKMPRNMSFDSYNENLFRNIKILDELFEI